jgi:hypothetical protein
VTESKEVPAAAPPLLASVPQEPDAPARAMTATQIADLGGAIYGERDSGFYTQRWRRNVLHDAPARIERISPLERGVSPGKVSDIVHKALDSGSTREVPRTALCLPDR